MYQAKKKKPVVKVNYSVKGPNINILQISTNILVPQCILGSLNMLQ